MSFQGITAGYLPLGATLTTDKVYRAFYADYEKRKTFYHGHTYTANPISCAAALASLEIFKKENTLGKIRELIPRFHGSLEKFRNIPIVGDVRYAGMIGAIELVKDKRTKKTFGLNERIGLKVYEAGLKRKIILRPLGDVIYLYLPLCIKKAEMDAIVNRVFETIREISNAGAFIEMN